MENIDAIKRLSKLYGERATMLTNGIEQAEMVLMELPGKVRVATDIGDGARLLWDRCNSDRWRIFYCWSDGESPLASCSVEVKAHAVKYLGCLFEDIEAALKKKNDAVCTGLGALDLFFKPAKGEQ